MSQAAEIGFHFPEWQEYPQLHIDNIMAADDLAKQGARA